MSTNFFVPARVAGGGAISFLIITKPSIATRTCVLANMTIISE